MMILRLVQRPDGKPPDSTGCPLEPAGSTIGRAPDCNLVLDDPLRMVSRRHAWIVPQADDQALVRCTSTTSSLLVNGELLASGAERTVRVGDRLSIGGFELLLDSDELTTVTLPAPSDTVAAPAALPQWSEPVAAEPLPGQREPRLDQWFNLDSIADPLGPGSPLPALDSPPRVATARAVAHDPAPAATAAPAPLRGPQRTTTDVAAPRRGDPTSLLQPAVAVPDRRQPAPGVPEQTPASPRADTAPQLSDDVDALRRAFLRGAGLDEGAPLMLDPARMAQFGAMLRVTVEGMSELLQFGAGVEAPITTEGTHFLVRKKNPLRFAPDAMEALRLLLSTAGWPGFLDPVEALRDAHHDVRAQQQALVDALRVAVIDQVAHAAPDAIESAEGPAQGLARLVPLLRHAALWRRQVQHHALLRERLDALFEAASARSSLRVHEPPSAPDSVSRLRPREVHPGRSRWPDLDIET